MKLTNNKAEFAKVLKGKLEQCTEDTYLIFTVIMPVLVGSYSIHLIKRELPVLMVKKFARDWRELAKYGLYDFDQIVLSTFTTEINGRTFNQIAELENVKFFEDSDTGVIIDGAECYLQILINSPIKYEWNRYRQLSKTASQLLDELFNCAFR